MTTTTMMVVVMMTTTMKMMIIFEAECHHVAQAGLELTMHATTVVSLTQKCRGLHLGITHFALRKVSELDLFRFG